MPGKVCPHQRQAYRGGFEGVGPGGGAPPAPACGAQRGAQRPRDGAQAKNSPLGGGVAGAQMQLARPGSPPQNTVCGTKPKPSVTYASSTSTTGSVQRAGAGKAEARACGVTAMGAGAGSKRAQRQPPHNAATHTSARPHHTAPRLCSARLGTKVADSRAPTPMPQNMSGPRAARRASGVAAMAMEGPSTISVAPAMPEISRQTKEHGHGLGKAAADKAQRHCRPAQHQHAHCAQPVRQRGCSQCTDQIAQQVGGAQVGHLLAREPAGQHHLRHQRGVGKTGQSHAAERGQKAGEKRGSSEALNHRGPCRAMGSRLRGWHHHVQ